MMILSINNLIQIYFPNWCLENCCIVWTMEWIPLAQRTRSSNANNNNNNNNKTLGKLTGKYGSPLLEKLKTSCVT